jgi:hypothetical protein
MREALAILQARFVDAVARVPVAHGLEPRRCADFVRARDEAEAHFRIGIYRAMHESRLVDVLAEDFPRVRIVVGEATFGAVARGYLRAHPSRSHELSRLSVQFPAFLEEHPLTRDRVDLSDIARLDRIRNEVFDEADDDPLRFEDIRRAFESRADPRVRRVSASALLGTTFAIGGAWAAADDRRAPAVSEVGPRTLLVWRREHVVRHRTVAGFEYGALRALEYGLSLGDLCTLLAGADGDQGAQRVFDTLSQWAADALLALASG